MLAVRPPFLLVILKYISINKKDVCISPELKLKHQRPILSDNEAEGRRFKPKPQEQPLNDSVLELITDPLNQINAFQARDLCYRLNGELMTRPQTKEEETLMDEVMWDSYRQ